jgi:hypothetical protein
MIAEKLKRLADQQRAEARSEGLSQGRAEIILQMVADGDLPRERALVRLRHLHEQHQIDDQVLAQALSTLGA